jgi:F-type H+-transporting ATPase subunit b
LSDTSKQAHFSARVFRFVLLAALVAGMAIAPYRLAAQQTAPPANQATAEKTASSSEAADSQEAQNQAFRLEGPLVKATAKALNLPVTTVANIFEIINFAIIVLGIGIPLIRWMPRFLSKRAEKVRTDIEAARKVTEDANSRLSAVEAKLASIGEEIEKFRVEVERECVEDEARIKSTLKEESARILAAAEQEIASAAAQARRGLRNFAADLAVDQAAKKLVLTPETDRALIAEFVGDVAKGGQN